MKPHFTEAIIIMRSMLELARHIIPRACRRRCHDIWCCVSYLSPTNARLHDFIALPASQPLHIKSAATIIAHRRQADWRRRLAESIVMIRSADITGLASQPSTRLMSAAISSLVNINASPFIHIKNACKAASNNRLAYYKHAYQCSISNCSHAKAIEISIS